MGTEAESARAVASRHSLSTRLQAFRVRKGWNMDRLAEEAGISRTTVYHLERGDIAKPRASTLYKLAVALQVDPQQLAPDHSTPGEDGLADASPSAADRRESFDRRTNHRVKAAYDAAPVLFTGWSHEQWEELYSTFGVGGPLTEHGVLEIARKINRKRETLHQLQVILETHHAETAAGLVANLYRLVQAELDAAMSPAASPGETSTTITPPVTGEED